MRLIARVGFREASIDKIAADADISPTSIYWHFGNREGLLAALAKSITDQYVITVAREWRRVVAASPEEVVRSYVRSMVRFAVDQPDVVRTQIALSTEGAMLPALFGDIRTHNREARRPITEAVNAGVRSGIFRPIAGSVWVDFVIGSVLGATIQSSLHSPGFDPRPLLGAIHGAALSLLGLE